MPTAVVTSSSRGLGLEFVRQLARGDSRREDTIMAWMTDSRPRGAPRADPEEATASFRELPHGARLVVVVALIALALHLSAIALDATALILIALALSPWITVLVEKLKFGDFELTLRRRQDRQQAYIDSALRLLLTTAVSEWEGKHLERFAGEAPFPAQMTREFRAELERLLAVGLIRRRPAKGLRTLERADPTDDARDHFEITQAGLHLLALRRDVAQRKEEAAAEGGTSA